MESQRRSSGSGDKQGQTLARGSAMLHALARAREGRRLTEVAYETGLTKSTALRLLRALAAQGLAFTDEAGAWRLGLGLVTLGTRASQPDNLRHRFSSTLTRLAQTSGDTVLLCLRERDEILCIDRRAGAYPLRSLFLARGDRRPLGVGASGMAALAFLPEVERQAVIEAVAPRLSVWPGHTPAKLAQRVEMARAQGFAINQGDIIPSMWAIAAPLHTGSGEILGTLALTAVAERFAGDRLHALVQWLKAAVGDIEAALALPPPSLPPR